MASYVEVAVGLPVPGTYHYAVPPRLGAAAQVGARVLVPFGPRGVTGVIVGQADASPVDGVKPVREVLDDAPALEPELIALCLWIADYYEAPPGEVVRAALPSGTDVTTRARLVLTDKGRRALAGESGAALPAALVRQLGKVESGKRPADARVVASLVEGGWIETAQERREARVKVRQVRTARLVRPPSDEERRWIDRSARRRQVLGVLEAADGPVDLSVLRKEVKGATSVLRPLCEAGLVERGVREEARDPFGEEATTRLRAPLASEIDPSPAQKAALDAVAAALDGRAFEAFLLHGITGSGKTEVYLRAIARVLDGGGGAIVLVPEIALTPQLAARFRARFGDQVAVLHSGLTPGERFDQWRRLRSGQARIALGARSAIFAPVRDLRMIVVDEEHDSSFKQEEGVRYHARDVALVRAQRAGAVCVLGSATPSLESYANAKAGRYRLLELPSRPTASPLPEVQVVDLRTYRPDGESLLTAPLAEAIQKTLDAGEQVILFLNRRGFATFVVCVACGGAFRCGSCSVSLTYHRRGDLLRCHYCGHSERLPGGCPACQARGSIRRFGLGTERIEHALAEQFPGARVARLDRDTAAGRGLKDTLERFAGGEIDILVGTQMVTKGHDFPGVTLVGVLMADSALSLPDFRAAERTFQLLMQVAGRAGRGDRPGKVIVQAYAPSHPAIACAERHDYAGFFASEAASRAELGYPPAGKLVALRLDGTDEGEVRRVAAEIAGRAARLAAQAEEGGVRVMGPSEAPLARLKGRTRWHVWIRGPERGPLRRFLRRLTGGLDSVRGNVRITVDVDPVSAL